MEFLRATWSRMGCVAAIAALLACGSNAQRIPLPGPSPARPRPSTAGPRVSVVLTTDDQTQLMAAQPPVSFSIGAGGSNPIFVDENQQYQEIEGFGASFTDSSGYLLNKVATPSGLSSAMNNLFTRNGSGIGLSFMRIPMGASDLSLSIYSYDDMAAGASDPSLANFSVAHDQSYIVPLIVQAKQLNPAMKLMANPWSPPGWMKTSGSMIGGTLLPTMYTPFANYFVKFVQAYAAAGIGIDYLSLQNEPEYSPTAYPGMLMDAPTQTTVLRDYMLPALSAAGLTPRVLVYDHNWSDASYPATVFSDSTILASAQVAGTAWHGYGGTPGAMTTVANEFPAKGTYETEHSGGTWIADQVKNDFEEIPQCLRNWAKAYVKWGLALNENRGPYISGGCETCSPLVTVNSSSGAITYFIDYYTLGHFSKYVLPGAHRIYSNNGMGVISVAFINPDGSKVLVAFNDTSSSQTFQVRWGPQSFSYTLAALSGATFTWSGVQQGTYAMNAGLPIQASSFNSVAGGLQTESTSDSTGGFDVGYSSGGAYAVYKNVDFGSGATAMSARMACDQSGGNCGGTLEFHLDSATGAMAGSVTIPGTGGWQNWQTAQGTATSTATGVHDLYLVFKAPTSGAASLGNVNWFQFAVTSGAGRNE